MQFMQLMFAKQTKYTMIAFNFYRQIFTHTFEQADLNQSLFL